MGISLLQTLEVVTCISEVVALVFIHLALRELRKATASHKRSNEELAQINARIMDRSKFPNGRR